MPGIHPTSPRPQEPLSPSTSYTSSPAVPKAFQISQLNTDSWIPTVKNVAGRLFGWSRPANTVDGLLHFQLTPSLFTPISEEEKTQLQQLLVGLHQAGALEDATARGTAIKEVLAKHPEVFNWLANKRSIAEMIETNSTLKQQFGEALPTIHQLDLLTSRLLDGYRLWSLGSALIDNVKDAQTLYQDVNEHGVKDYCKTKLPVTIGTRAWNMGKHYLKGQVVQQTLNALKGQLSELTPEDRLSILDKLPNSLFESIGTQIHTSLAAAQNEITE